MRALIKYSEKKIFEKDYPAKKNIKYKLLYYIPVLLTGAILTTNYIYFEIDKKTAEKNFFQKTEAFYVNEREHNEYVLSKKENIFTEKYVDDVITYIENLPLKYQTSAYIALHSNLRWKIKNPIERINGKIRKQSNEETALLKTHLVKLKTNLTKHTELYASDDLNSKTFNLKDDLYLNDQDALIFRVTNSFPFLDIFNQNAKITKNILNIMSTQNTEYNDKSIAVVNHAIINTHNILFSSEYEKFKDSNFLMYEQYIKEHGFPDRNSDIYNKLKDEYQKKLKVNNFQIFDLLYGTGFSNDFKQHMLGQNYYKDVNLTKIKMIEMLKSL